MDTEYYQHQRDEILKTLALVQTTAADTPEDKEFRTHCYQQVTAMSNFVIMELLQEIAVNSMPITPVERGSN